MTTQGCCCYRALLWTCQIPTGTRHVKREVLVRLLSLTSSGPGEEKRDEGPITGVVTHAENLENSNLTSKDKNCTDRTHLLRTWGKNIHFVMMDDCKIPPEVSYWPFWFTCSVLWRTPFLSPLLGERLTGLNIWTPVGDAPLGRC